MGEIVNYYTYAELNERRMKAEEENRQLKKEKKWLVERYIKDVYSGDTVHQTKMLLQRMQQALKGE